MLFSACYGVSMQLCLCMSGQEVLELNIHHETDPHPCLFLLTVFKKEIKYSSNIEKYRLQGRTL